jgi:hypothetical protein
MKLFLISLLFIPSTIFSQTYVPFVSTTDSSDTWMDVNSCTDFNCYDTYINRYTIDGDTMIGGLQFMKIYIKTEHEKGADQSQWCDESISYYENYYGALRESGKKIYVIKDIFTPVEYMAYDFNLVIGDTIPSPDGSATTSPTNHIISSIDSVLVFGAYRKRYLVNSNKYVVEGIGASTGLFNPFDFQSSQCEMRMLCYSEYNTPDYFLTNCEMNLSTPALTVIEPPAQLIKIVDYLGRETDFRPNTPLVYIYSDGSTKRVFRIEE